MPIAELDGVTDDLRAPFVALVECEGRARRTAIIAGGKIVIFRYPLISGQFLPDLLWCHDESFESRHDSFAQ
jgi:hypothetical protein